MFLVYLKTINIWLNEKSNTKYYYYAFAVYLKGDTCISGDIQRKPNIKFSEKKKRGTK